jgi:hypothetical protein
MANDRPGSWEWTWDEQEDLRRVNHGVGAASGIQSPPGRSRTSPDGKSDLLSRYVAFEAVQEWTPGKAELLLDAIVLRGEVLKRLGRSQEGLGELAMALKAYEEQIQRLNLNDPALTRKICNACLALEAMDETPETEAGREQRVRAGERGSLWLN